MKHTREVAVFRGHLARKGLKHSARREAVLAAFLDIEGHVSAEELFSMARKTNPSIGLATVYRTLSLICEGGLARALTFEDGTTRYEHAYEHAHHDHLVCTQCGRVVEVVDAEIERLQERLFRAHGFHPQRHRMDLYGLCGACRK